MHNSTTKRRPLPKLQASIVLCLDVLAFQFQRLNRKIDETLSKKTVHAPKLFLLRLKGD